ncbi:MAG: hypothetical protein HZA52_03675 [Planctomycetes bacterium]|nr:hypothetical protein [Planctomycetota bacterium]
MVILYSSQKTLVVVGVLSTCAIILLLVIGSDESDDKGDAPVSFAQSEQLPADGTAIASAADQVDGRDELSGQASSAPESAAQGSAESVDRLVAAKDDLAFFATDSLNGVMYVNAVLEHVLAFASLPVETHPDFEYEDDDAIAYKITGLPGGMEGHLLVGLQPYSNESGKTCRYLQMELKMPSAEPEFLDGAMRDGPNVFVSVSYETEAPNVPVRFGLMLQRRVDLSASRKEGIDAYSGVHTQGAYYAQDMLDATRAPFASTVGLVNGNPADGNSFPGVSPLVGDVRLDPGLLSEVLAQFQKNLSSVKGE